MGLVKGERCMMNSEQHPKQHAEKPMSQAAIGRALGLSPASMTKLKGQGMPVHSVAAAQAWREARQNLAQRKPAPDVAPAPTMPSRAPWVDPAAFGGAGPDMPGLGEDRDEARTRREIAEANMAEMDEARLRRELIRVSAVQAQLSTDYATTRDALLQIPARMAPLLAAEKDPAAVQNLLHAEIHQALMTLAGAAEHVPSIEGAFD
jgi:hypothetical protein